MEGLIILIVTLVAFLAMGIYIIVKIVKGPDLPDGHKLETTFAGNKAILIVDKDIPSFKDKNSNQVVAWLVEGQRIEGADLVEKCAQAIAAAETGFQKKGVQKANVDRVVFNYVTDKNYENSGGAWWRVWSKGTGAYSTLLCGMFGTKKTPLSVIRSKYMRHTLEKGQPVIHELVHILNKSANGDYSHNHSDPKLWLGPGGSDSVEGIAVAQWTELVKAINENQS